MQTTFEALLNPDNSVRTQAESTIARQFEAAPMELATALVTSLNDKPEVATMCCVLIKKYFLDKRSTKQLSEADLQSLLGAVQTSIQDKLTDSPLHLLKQKGDVLTRVYMLLGKSVELMSMLASMMTHQDVKVRQFVMHCFEVLAEISMDSEQLAKMSSDLKTIFEQGLKDQENAVRVASLRAVTTFLASIEDQDVVMKFVPVLDLILMIIVEALKFDEESGRVGLEALENLTTAHAEIWKNPSKLLEITSEVIKHKGFEEGTRSAATEVVLALAQNMPAVLRKAPEMKSAVFPALTMMLLEVEQDNSVWEEQEEDVDMVGKDPVSTAMSSLLRLTQDLGSKTTMACTDHIISELLQSLQTQAPDWTKIQAGFVLMGVISAATKGNKEYMQNTMQIFLNLRYDNVRVQYSALLSLGMIFTNWAPNVQKQYHQLFFPMLINKMKDTNQNKKMLTQVTSVVLSFVQGLIEEQDDDSKDKEEFDVQALIKPYAKDLLTNLVALLKIGISAKYEPLQAESLNLLHSMCSVMLADFGQFFNDFMPMMKEILSNVGNSTMEDKKLRAKTIETIGAIICAVADCEDKVPYAAGVKEITENLAQFLNQGLSDDDPQDEAIKSTLTQSAAFLQKDFAPYMEFLFSHLLKDAALEIDCKVENADMPTMNKDEGFKVKVKGLGEQRVTVKTENLVKKVSAFSLIDQVSEGMGTAFAPYAEKLLPVVTQHMTYGYSHKIKKFSLSTFINILVAVGEQQNIQLFQQALPMYMEQITTNGLNKMDKKQVKTYLKYLAETLKALNRNNEYNREFLSDEQIAAFGPVIKRTLDLVTALRAATLKVIQKQRQNQEIDEEDIEKMKEDLAKVSKIASQVMELTGQLVEIFKNRAFGVVRDNALGFFAKQLELYQDLTEDELLDMLCFFCDYVENTDANKDIQSVNQIASKFIEVAKHQEDQHEYIVQTICYGLGVFGSNLPNGQFKGLKQAVELCREFVAGDDADRFSDERIVGTESTFGALANIAYMHLDNSIIGNQDLAGVFSRMPFTAYEDENKNAHRRLMRQFMDSTSHVHNAQVRPAAVAALKRIRDYQGDKKILTAECKEQIMKLQL